MYDSPEEVAQMRFEVVEVVAAQRRQLVVAVLAAAVAGLVVLVMQAWQQLKRGFPEKLSET